MPPDATVSRSPDDTRALARDVIDRLGGSGILALYGNLGSGKTCFVQGVAEALGINRPITSPTFTIVNEYHGAGTLNHIDLYRLNSPDEALALGFEEYLESDGVTAVEWADRADDLIPETAVRIEFAALTAPTERAITIHWPDGMQTQ